MKPAFRNLTLSKPMVAVRFNGEVLRLAEGENLAAALLSAGIQTFRYTPVSDAPRGPFCMMGACYDCLVDIDGVTRQACMIEVSEGMEIRAHNKGERQDD